MLLPLNPEFMLLKTTRYFKSPISIKNETGFKGSRAHFVITVTDDIFKKLKIIGYNLDDYSLDTVKMFYDDAKKAGYTL